MALAPSSDPPAKARPPGASLTESANDELCEYPYLGCAVRWVLPVRAVQRDAASVTRASLGRGAPEEASPLPLGDQARTRRPFCAAFVLDAGWVIDLLAAQLFHRRLPDGTPSSRPSQVVSIAFRGRHRGSRHGGVDRPFASSLGLFDSGRRAAAFAVARARPSASVTYDTPRARPERIHASSSLRGPLGQGSMQTSFDERRRRCASRSFCRPARAPEPARVRLPAERGGGLGLSTSRHFSLVQCRAKTRPDESITLSAEV